MKFKKNKENIITFRAQNEHVWEVREKPVPSSKVLPNWWKEMKLYTNSENKFKLEPAPTVTVKRCAPILDALTSGYIVPLWTDVIVSKENNFPLIKWGSSEAVFDLWNEKQVSEYEIPNGFSSLVLKYMHGWTIKTPPGWSSLFIQPVGYQNSPFKAITGIVDTDVLETDINVPILIKNDFEGIIEKGIPMFQIIPIKRNDWKSNFILEDKNQLYFNTEKLRTKLVASYARHLRIKKSYK
jgi:hypothetical protein